jgi:splicing factor 3B subunit 5
LLVVEVGGMDQYSTARAALNQTLERLQAKYAGTGHADTSRHEWAVQQHRDTAAVFVGDPALMQYAATVENVSLARYRYELIERMYKPCGDPPAQPQSARDKEREEEQLLLKQE